MEILSAINVSKDYCLGKTTIHALKSVSLKVDRGAFTAIAGPSGSGKSTLLNIFGCLDCPTGGEIWIDKTNVSTLNARQLDAVRLNKIGFIFQVFNLIPVLDVYENIELPLMIHNGLTSREKKKRVEYFIERVGLLDQKHQKPFELSGGQRQRVAVARALVTQPAIVLADEPTANLDSHTGVEIIELMHEMNTKESTTFVFSTHDFKILQKAQKIVHLQDGIVRTEEEK